MLNYLHRKGFYKTLCLMSQTMYFIKGFGYVKATYHKAFRAYEYKVWGTVYLSLGPGWAFNFEYLKEMLTSTYCHQYLPQSGDCVVEIGAGLGEEVSVYALLVGDKGVVHALEANPATYAGLKYMCEENKFGWVMPHHIAIYNTDGEVTIEDDEENYLTNTINVTLPSKPEFKVKAKTLDTLVKEHNISKINFLKSNIEGAEQYLIEGMNESVKIIQNICISCHDFRHNYHNHGEFYMTKHKVKTFLETNGFEITTRSTGNVVVDDFIYAKSISIN